MNRSVNQNGRPMDCSTLSPTAQAGGISIVGKTNVLRHSTQWKPNLVNHNGNLASRPTAFLQPTSLSAHTRVPVLTISHGLIQQPAPSPPLKFNIQALERCERWRVRCFS